MKTWDERKYMMDREILDKYINLDNSCLTKVEKTQVRDLLYKYAVRQALTLQPQETRGQLTQGTDK